LGYEEPPSSQASDDGGLLFNQSKLVELEKLSLLERDSAWRKNSIAFPDEYVTTREHCMGDDPYVIRR
jgi:hypothetical protein